MKKASAALMDVEAARDELLSRAELGDTAGGAWGRLDRRFQQARCVLGFLAGLGQA